jgi:fluoroacetyl-CoA thioesterase
VTVAIGGQYGWLRLPARRPPLESLAVGWERPAIGEEASLEVTVTEDMLVNLRGRRIHPVYSTVSMVLHMEEAGRELVERHFGPGEDATGYRVAVTHERPARVGDRLLVVARVTGIDDRDCSSDVEVLGPSGRVGHGSFVQRYIRKGQLD